MIDGEDLREQEAWDDEYSAVVAREHQEEDSLVPSELRENEVDAVSAASEPPNLFVEIISPIEGDTRSAGFSISAFGGPGWAIPEMELHVDGTQVDGMAGFNVVFDTAPDMAEGSHTFDVQFTCVLESCLGQTASASVNLNVTAGNSDPDDPNDPIDPIDPDDPTEPDDPSDSPDDPNESGQGAFVGNG